MSKQFIAALIVCSCLLINCTNEKKEANRMFMDTNDLVQKAIRAEKTDFSEACQLYRKAISTLEILQLKYPGQEITVKVSSHEARFGSLSKDDLKKTLALCQEKVSLEKDPILLALRLIGKIEDRGYGSDYRKAEMISEIVDRLIGLGQYSQAFQTAKLIEKAEIRNREMMKMLEGSSKTKQIEDIKNILEYLWNENGNKGPFFGQEKILTTIAVNYIALGDFMQAIAIAQKARQLCLAVQKVLLPEIVGKITEAGKPDLANQVLTIYKDDLFLTLLMRLRICRVVYQSGEKEKGLELLAKFEKDFQGMPPYARGAEVLLEQGKLFFDTGQTKKAIEIFKLFFTGENKGEKKISGWIEYEMLVEIAGKYFGIGFYPQAFEVITKIKDQDLQLRAIGNLEADKLPQKEKDKYKSLLLALFAEASKTDDQYTRDPMLSKISSRLLALGYIDEAFRVAEKMSSTSDLTEVYKELAKHFILHGKYEDLVNSINRLAGIYQKVFVLSQVSEVCASSGRFEEAFDLVQKIRGLSVNESEDGSEKHMSTDDEKEILEENARKALSEIAKVFIGKKDFDQALKIAGEMKDPDFKDMLLSDVAMGLFESGEDERADWVWPEIKNKCRQIKTRINMAKKYCASGQQDKSLALISEWQSSAGRFRACDRSAHNENVLDVARLYIQMGKNAIALKMSLDNDDQIIVVKTLEEIGYSFLSSKQKADAELQMILHGMVSKAVGG